MSQPFTVIGYWDEDRPVSVGVIEGQHAVHAGEGATEQGDWATYALADSPEDAEELAIAEMRASNEDGLDQDDDEGGKL